MELIAAVLIAGPLGYFVRRHSLWIYLGLWAVIFPIQTVVVNAENASDINPSYFVVNAVILALGIGLNRVGYAVAARRRSASAASDALPGSAV
jgi:hypothetical protein